MAITRLGLGGPIAGRSSRVRSYLVTISSAGTWTPIGGATLTAVVSDSNEGTYMQSSLGTGDDVCTLAFPTGVPGPGTLSITLRHRATP
jgi:hypothetical protein